LPDSSYYTGDILFVAATASTWTDRRSVCALGRVMRTRWPGLRRSTPLPDLGLLVPIAIVTVEHRGDASARPPTTARTGPATSTRRLSTGPPTPSIINEGRNCNSKQLNGDGQNGLKMELIFSTLRFFGSRLLLIDVYRYFYAHGN
jgi:hypothetical protein